MLFWTDDIIFITESDWKISWSLFYYHYPHCHDYVLLVLTIITALISLIFFFSFCFQDEITVSHITTILIIILLNFFLMLWPQKQSNS